MNQTNIPNTLVSALGYDKEAKLICIRWHKNEALLEDGLVKYNPPAIVLETWAEHNPIAAELLQRIKDDTMLALCIDRQNNQATIRNSEMLHMRLIAQWGEKYSELKANTLPYTPYLPEDVPPWLSIDLASNDEIEIRLQKLKQEFMLTTKT